MTVLYYVSVTKTGTAAENDGFCALLYEDSVTDVRRAAELIAAEHNLLLCDIHINVEEAAG